MVGSFIKDLTKQEISCKIARMILKYAETMKIPSESILRGTGANLPFLFESTNWTGENIISTLLKNLYLIIDEKKIEEKSSEFLKTLEDDEIFNLIFEVTREPFVFYRNLPKWYSLHIRTSELTIQKEEENGIIFRLEQKSGKFLNESFIKFLLKIFSCAATGFDIPPANVDLNPPLSKNSKSYKISIRWDNLDSKNLIKNLPDPRTMESILRKIIRRIEKAESQKTELNRMAFLLRESERWFMTFFNNVSEPVMIVDQGGYIADVNIKTLRLLDCVREELVGTPFAKLVEKKEQEMIGGLLNIARQGRPIPSTEIELIKKDMTKIPVEMNATAIMDPDSGGAPFKVLLTLKDLSLLRTCEEEAKRMRDLNEIIVNGMLEGIFVENADGICKFANPRMEEMLGYERGELVGKHWTETVPDGYVGPIEEELVKRRMGIKGFYEAKLKRKDGSLIPVKISALPIFEGGSFGGVISVVIDLSDVPQILPKTNKNDKE